MFNKVLSVEIWTRPLHRTILTAMIAGLSWANVVASRGVPLEHLAGAMIICGLSGGIVVVALFVVRLPRNRSRGHGGVGCRVGFAARSVE